MTHFISPLQHQDGYINATALAHSYYYATGNRKDVHRWLKLKGTQGWMERISQETQMEVADLVRVVKGGVPHSQGTWIHPDLGIRFGMWLSPDFGRWVEQRIQRLLATARQTPTATATATPTLAPTLARLPLPPTSVIHRIEQWSRQRDDARRHSRHYWQAQSALDDDPIATEYRHLAATLGVPGLEAMEILQVQQWLQGFEILANYPNLQAQWEHWATQALPRLEQYIETKRQESYQGDGVYAVITSLPQSAWQIVYADYRILIMSQGHPWILSPSELQVLVKGVSP